MSNARICPDPMDDTEQLSETLIANDSARAAGLRGPLVTPFLAS